MLRFLTAKDTEFLCYHLGLNRGDLAAVLAELDRDDRAAEGDSSFASTAGEFERRKGKPPAVFSAADFFALDAHTTIFLSSKNCHLRAQSRDATGADLQGASARHQALRGTTALESLGLSADFQQFLTAGELNDRSRVATASGFLSSAQGGGMRKTASVSVLQGRSLQQASGTLRSRTAAAHSQSALFSSSLNVARKPHSERRGTSHAGEGESTESLTRALIESLRSMDKHSKMVRHCH